MYVFIYLLMYLFIYLFMYVFIYLLMYLFIYLFMYLFIHSLMLPFHLCARLRTISLPSVSNTNWSIYLLHSFLYHCHMSDYADKKFFLSTLWKNIFRQNRWGWVVIFTLRLLHRRESPTVPTVQEAGWVPQQVWTFWKSDKPLAPAGIWTPDSPARSIKTWRWELNNQQESIWRGAVMTPMLIPWRVTSDWRKPRQGGRYRSTQKRHR
jgi:hypothetical protein